MIIIDEERASDSPFIERIWRSHSEGSARPFLSIAVSHCELVVSRLRGKVTVSLRGPETRATPVSTSSAEGEWFGILLKLGTYLPHLPASGLVDGMVSFAPASRDAFWLGGSVWQIPDVANAEAFVERLARAGLLALDPVVEAAARGEPRRLTQRAIQYRFVQATGITQRTARQIERARQTAFLLQHGTSIRDTLLQAGYYDQAHLTRSLTHYIGQTPAQLLHSSRPEQLSLLYKTTNLP